MKKAKKVSVKIYLHYHISQNEQFFKLVDVPGDGDCFYYSVLKIKSLSDRFPNVQSLRSHLINTVLSTYNSDQYLQFLFNKENVEVESWCSIHAIKRRMGNNI